MAAAVDVDLNKTFLKATKYVQSIVSQLNDSVLLELYSYYKQATEGVCAKPAPSWYQIKEKKKWEAWSNLKNMTCEDAMKKYIALLTSLDDSWLESDMSKSNWVHHSSMVNEEQDLQDSEKTVFDWVKENNLENVKTYFKGDKINELDGDGMGYLHWAADRGNLEIIRYLVCELKTDVNIRDEEGQTPLHFASCCGHQDVVEFLLSQGADCNLRDNEQQLAIDVADNQTIIGLINPFMS